MGWLPKKYLLRTGEIKTDRIKKPEAREFFLFSGVGTGGFVQGLFRGKWAV
jgi:hypothetical protein